MIKSMRIHHTSDGGTFDIGVSEKTVIEVGGTRVSLAVLLQVSGLVEIGTVGGELRFAPHECQMPDGQIDFETASERAYKES